MRHEGLRVGRTHGEETRRRLTAAGLLRPDLKILEEGPDLIFPVAPSAVVDGWGTRVEREFPERGRNRRRSYRELLPWSTEDRARAPRAFDIVGDVVLIRIPRPLEDRADEIGAALLGFVPGSRLVGADHGVEGPERRRRLTRIAGEGPWRTQHRENGLTFDVDPERAYFSPRLAGEHARVADAVGAGERVLDLCAGVGPFSLTIASRARPKRITGVEMNPDACALFRSTRARYGWDDRVEVLRARIEEFLPATGEWDRVVFNLPREGIKYLPSVARAVAAGGTLHYYELRARGVGTARTGGSESVMPETAPLQLVEEHPVHGYSPAADLIARTFRRAR